MVKSKQSKQMFPNKKEFNTLLADLYPLPGRGGKQMYRVKSEAGMLNLYYTSFQLESASYVSERIAGTSKNTVGAFHFLSYQVLVHQRGLKLFT